MKRTRLFLVVSILSLAGAGTYAPGAAAVGSNANPAVDFSISTVRAAATKAARTTTATAADHRLGSQGLQVVTSPAGDAAIVDTSLINRGIISAASPSFVSLSWDAHSPTTRYTVTRDGRPLTQLGPGVTTFRDTSVTGGATYTYRVSPSTSASADATMWSMKVEVPSSADTSSAAALTDAALKRMAAAGVGTTSTLSWVTFIPQARIDAPVIAGKAICTYGSGYQFGGDNHGFVWTAASNRTAVHAVVTWSTKAVSSHTSIGTTNVYRKSTGALVAQRTASASQTYAKKLGSGSNYVDIHMVTHASNPFCPSVAGAIDGAFSITLTQSGSYAIFSGKHRQMPNHYVYLYDQSAVKDVYKLTYANPLCLFGAATCALATFWGSGSF